MPFLEQSYDVIVIGGGPAGATAALQCVRQGLSTILLEKDRHPRFHIGESFLPRHQALIRELGLLDEVKKIPQVPKFGASFAMGNSSRITDFFFAPGPNGEEAYAFNIERAPFDEMLVRVAGEHGVEVHQNVAVKSIEHLADGDVALSTTSGPLRACLLLDASGQSTVVGRHLGTRQPLPDLRRVAYYGHFDGVHRREGRLGGSPLIVMCDEGWFWLIPIDDRRTSIGLVVSMDTIKTAKIKADDALAWGIARCPLVRQLTASATAPSRNYVTADFSYRCAPFAGPGYFLVGDAATFVDPIFSTGVCLGMVSAVQAANGAKAILSNGANPRRVQRNYSNYVDNSSSVFFRLVRRYYRHGFRELFLNGVGPLDVHNAVIATLAGHVFPRPPFRQRWRVKLFEILLEIHERHPLAPLRNRFSLLASGPMTPLEEPVMACLEYAESVS